MSSTKNELDLDLECSLCKDIFREPKTLGCLHSFCLECLEIYVERNHSNIGLKCPICRTPFQFQSKDQLANLSTDSYLLNALNAQSTIASHCNNFSSFLCSDEENEATHYCLDCEEHYCEVCTKSHKTMKVTKNHQLISIEEMLNENQLKSLTISSPRNYCQIHQEKEIELFCEDCKEATCLLCISKHPSHKLLAISDIIDNEKQLLIDLINQVQPKEKELREGVNKCEEIIKQLEINSTTTQIQINQFFNNIRNKLDEKEQELLNKLEEIEKHKKKELEIQKEELKFGIESIIGSCQMIQNSISLSNINNKNDARLLSMKTLYQSRLNYLSNSVWDVEPCHHSFIEHTFDKSDEQSIFARLLNVHINSNEISPEKCFVSRDDKQKIYENEKFKFAIISYSKDGNQMKTGGNGKRFIIHIEEESKNMKREDNEKNECEIVDLNNGKYEVKLKLEDEGKYSIFVKFNGIDINSSPFQIQVFSKLKQRNYNRPKLFGSNGNGIGQFNDPYGICVDSNGNILVCDECNHRIQIFNSDGKFISAFGEKGEENGQFKSPIGIAINSRDNIIISERGNNRIQIFDSEGKFISTFKHREFRHLYGICVDLNDNIFVCNGNKIQKFNSEGEFILAFGSNGNGQFNVAKGITINSKGNVIVSDPNRIQIFDSKGKFISIFGSKGCGNGQFKSPEALCVDQDDHIFVCDYGNNRIQIFNSNGEYILQIGMNQPKGIAIDPKTQNLIVNGSIQGRLRYDLGSITIFSYGT